MARGSFPTPARPRPGRFPWGTTGLRGGVGVSPAPVRIALVQPAAAVLRYPGERVRFAAAHIARAAGPTVDGYRWTVRVFSEARSAPHPHFWYERETPYRVITSTLSPSSEFSVSAEEADRGFSTWEVRVDVLAGTVVLGTGVAVFALELAMAVVPGVLVDPWVLPACTSAPATPGSSSVSTTSVSTGIALPPPQIARMADPALLLDPHQVG